MMLAYDGIVFDLLLLEDWEREAVYTEDGTTFLFWHHTIVASCMLNTDATNAGDFPDLPFNAQPGGDGMVGAPGVKKNPKPNNLGKGKGGLPLVPGGNILQPSKEDTDFPNSFQGNTGPALVNPPGITGGGDFAPQPSPGENTGSSIDVQSGSIPLPPAFGGGDFGGAKRPAGKRPFIRFGPGHQNANDAGKKNPANPRQRSSLTVRRTIPSTDVELRARLRRPRRQLLVWLHSGSSAVAEFMLVSPLSTEAESDAQHGPLCTILDVPAIHGEVSAVLRLKFETWEAPPLEWVTPDESTAKLISTQQAFDDALQRAKNANTPEGRAEEAARLAYLQAVDQGVLFFERKAKAFEAARREGVDEAKARQIAEDVENNGGQPAKPAGDGQVDGKGVKDGVKIKRRILATPALLSNRWSMAFGWNPQTYLKSQFIEGEAIFRMDVLSMRKLTADQLRRYIWHPIPDGYKRRPIGDNDIVLSPGGNGIKYRLIDDQVMMNFPGGVKWGCIHVEAATQLEYHGYDIVGQGNGRQGDGGANSMRGKHKE